MTSNKFAALVPPTQTNERARKIFHCPYDLCAVVRNFSVVRNLVGGSMAAPSWLKNHAAVRTPYRLRRGSEVIMCM